MNYLRKLWCRLFHVYSITAEWTTETAGSITRTRYAIECGQCGLSVDHSDRRAKRFMRDQIRLKGL